MEGIRAGGQNQSQNGHHSNGNSSNSNGYKQSNGHESQDHNKPAERDASPVPPPPQTLSPRQAAQAMVESGVNRHMQRIDILFLKAVWAGIFLSYGGMLEAVIGGSPSANQNNPGLLRLVEGLVFPVGLSMIVLTGTELLTSDMMFFFLAALKGRIPWWSVLYSYVVVFLGNLAGSLFFAMVLARYTGLITPAISNFIQNAAVARAVTPMWHEVFLRGIGCNILVCMSVYLASQASDLFSKVVGVWIPLTTFVVIQYEHVVADMFLIPLGIALNAPGVNVGLYIWKPLIAALVGNIVGAWTLSLSLYWMYLHDTSATVPGVPTTNGDVEDSQKPQKKRKVGPFGMDTFGHPTKLQHHAPLWHSNGHTKEHF